MEDFIWLLLSYVEPTTAARDLRCRGDYGRRLVRLADITEALEFDENPVGGKIR